MDYKKAIKILIRIKQDKDLNNKISKDMLEKGLWAFGYLYFARYSVRDILIKTGYTKQDLIELKFLKGNDDGNSK